MCPVFFLGNAAGIGWGQGQIYQLQPDGEWLMVAGFPLQISIQKRHNLSGPSLIMQPLKSI
jgi:hypothetical protein